MNKQLEEVVWKEAEARWPYTTALPKSKQKIFIEGASFYASLTGDQAGRYTEKDMKNALAEMADEMRNNGMGACSVVYHKATSFWDTIKHRYSESPSEPLREALEKIRDYKNQLMSGSDCYDEIQSIARKALSTIK